MPSKSVKLWLLAPLVALSACTSTPKVGGASNLKVMPGELPPPDRVEVSTATTPYYVGPYDKLEIDVFGIEQLEKREVQVDSEGRISFPLAGVLEVAGRSPSEIADLVTLALRQAYVRNPQVTVNLKEMVSQRITVEGEVKNPGLYPMLSKMTLLRAVAQASGTTEFSKLSDVVVFRTVNGQKLAALYDLNSIRHGVYADPDIYAGDIIMVGESRGRRLFKDILQTLPALTTPVVVAVDRLTN